MSEITPITREEKLWNGEDLEPLTREEMYIKRIFDKTQTIPDKPLTRKEILMEKAGEGGGGDITIKQLSVTANGTYSEEGTAYSPVNVAVPLAEKSVTENGVYNASADSVAGYSKVNVNVPLPDNAYLLKEASGSLVSFSDGADLPMPSFVCNIDAVQDLHGYDAPWVGGAGKNKFPILIGDDVWVGNQGATYTSSNGVLIIESLAPTNTSSGVYSSNNSKMRELLATLDGEYVYSFEIKCNKEAGITCGISSHGNIARTISTNWVRYEIPTTFSIGENVGCVFYNYSKTENLEIQVRNFMIQQGTTATPYEPYENICPISGHTEVNAWVRGKNLYPMLIGNDAFNNNNDGSYSTGANGELIVECSDRRYSGVYTHPQSEFFKLLNTILVLPCNVSFDIVANKSTNVSLGTGGLVAVDTTKKRVTIPFNTSVAFVVYSWSEAVTVTISNFMVSKSSDPTYEPHNPNSQTIQVSWQTEAGEVFGGYVDLASGELTATHKRQTGFTRGSQDSSNKLYNIGTISDIKAYTNASAISPYFVDSMFEKMSIQSARAAETPSIAHYNKALYIGGYIGKEAELDTLLETLQVKYELETPLTYQLTPTQIKSLKDDITNAWCSTGDVTLEYFGKEV